MHSAMHCECLPHSKARFVIEDDGFFQTIFLYELQVEL